MIETCMHSQISELAANPYVEVCWYFPSSREQYRLSGVVDIITASSTDEQLLQARQAAWARMSDTGVTQGPAIAILKLRVHKDQQRVHRML